MLVLTRRAGEAIMIDDEIELKVLKIRGSQVHLGIDAPKRPYIAKKCGCASMANPSLQAQPWAVQTPKKAPPNPVALIQRPLL